MINSEISEEEQALREEVFAEVFNGEVPESAAELNDESVNTESNVSEKPENEDPLAGIPAALRETIDGISSKLSTLTTLEERLKQTERRIGSIQNEFQAAKQAATEKKATAPTEAEMAAAAKDKAEWDDLKEEYPEWAEAIEKKLAATSAEFSKVLPDLQNNLTDLRTQQQRFVSSELLEGRLLSIKYPTWKETVNTKEYQHWLQTQPEDIQQKHYSGKTADDAIFVLDRFQDFQSQHKPTQDISAARKKRLSQAATTTGASTVRQKPQKSEADMTEEEIRDIEFGKIWG